MGLTVREKEHWKYRIDEKIRNRVKELIATEEPEFRKRIGDSAREQAIVELDVSKEIAKLKEIERERSEAEAKYQQLARKLEREHDDLYEKLSIELAGSTAGGRPFSHVHAVDSKIAERERKILQELMKSDPLGQQVLALENEQENLLDTVWLATSPVQVKQLWARMSEMLGQSLTTFQANAMAIEPVDESE